MVDQPNPAPGAPATRQATLTVPAESASPPEIIVLPGAASAEGITKGAGQIFYAGYVFRGDIYRGDLARGTAELFLDAPAGRFALGLHADRERGWLFVAGGYGAAHVYDLETGETVASYELGDVKSTLVNDVTMTSHGAFFTDSSQPCLYFVPVSSVDELGPARTIPTAAAAGIGTGSARVVTERFGP